MNQKMLGRIKWFKLEKGYGYITGYDEERYYFETINILKNTDPSTLKENTEVLFIPNMFTKIPYASEIELSK